MIRWLICTSACLTLALGAAAGPGWAAAPSTCAPSKTPISLSFTTTAKAPIYNNRLNIDGIRNLFASRGQPLSSDGPHRRALGVTYVQTVLSLQASTRYQSAGRGFCMYMDKVDAQFGWDRMEVFVASEYKSPGCEYRTILDHENQHVSINQGALREYAPQMRARLEAILAEQPPMFVTNPDQGADRMLQAVHQRMDASLNAFQQAMRDRNAAIDTDANYDATAELCNGWTGAGPPPRQSKPVQQNN